MSVITRLTCNNPSLLLLLLLMLLNLLVYSESVRNAWIFSVLVSGHTLGLTPYNARCPIPVQPISGFELLGMKWLPHLNLQQAKELTPYEVGTRQWKPSIHALTSSMYSHSKLISTL